MCTLSSCSWPLFFSLIFKNVLALEIVWQTVYWGVGSWTIVCNTSFKTIL